MKWRYNMIYVGHDKRQKTIEVLNEMGADGWELVAIKHEYGILKKPVE